MMATRNDGKRREFGASSRLSCGKRSVRKKARNKKINSASVIQFLRSCHLVIQDSGWRMGTNDTLQHDTNARLKGRISDRFPRSAVLGPHRERPRAGGLHSRPTAKFPHLPCLRRLGPQFPQTTRYHKTLLSGRPARQPISLRPSGPSRISHCTAASPCRVLHVNSLRVLHTYVCIRICAAMRSERRSRSSRPCC